MSILGEPTNWDDFFSEGFVPAILQLIIDCWHSIAMPVPDEHENVTTLSLYCAILRNHATCDIPFLPRMQDVEVDAELVKETGRKDIAFFPALNPDIYFCLECKRLNVLEEEKPEPMRRSM